MIKAGKDFDKYNENCEKVSNTNKKEFNSKLVYITKYLKAERKKKERKKERKLSMCS